MDHSANPDPVHAGVRIARRVATLRGVRAATRTGAVLAALALLPASPLRAQPAPNELAGAWECRLAGQSTHTPPILWIATRAAAEGPETFEVDGFSGVVRGEGRFAAGSGGWSQFDSTGTVPLWVKPAREGRRPGLLARLGSEGRPYLCMRLPYPPA